LNNFLFAAAQRQTEVKEMVTYIAAIVSAAIVSAVYISGSVNTPWG